MNVIPYVLVHPVTRDVGVIEHQPQCAEESTPHVPLPAKPTIEGHGPALRNRDRNHVRQPGQRPAAEGADADIMVAPLVQERKPTRRARGQLLCLELGLHPVVQTRRTEDVTARDYGEVVDVHVFSVAHDRFGEPYNGDLADAAC